MTWSKGARAALVQRWYDEGFYGPQTLADVILAGASRHPAAYIALESDTRPGREQLAPLVQRSLELAGALYRLGIRGGDVVAIQLPNWIEAALLSQSVLLLDAVLLPITAIYDTAELAYILDDAKAKALFLPGRWRNRDYRDSVAPLRERTRVQEFIVLDERAPHGAIDWNTFRDLAEVRLPLRAADPDDLAVLLYTSGTTSKPKGVMHTHNSLIAEAASGQPFWGEHGLGNHLSPWPFGHIAAIIPLLRFWLYGVNTVLADHWEPQFIARLVERHQIASTSGIPYFLSSLLEAADRIGVDISSLRSYGTGAANVPAELVETCHRRGIYAYRIYGSTEHPTITAGVPDDPVDKRINTDGRCLPGCRVRIVDDEGHDLAAGEEGEIATIGPDQFTHYLRDEHNEGAFLEGSWFLTGDIGRLDAEGYLTITDRKKNIIIRGGENISSREVEEALSSHPAVAECAAVARPDPKLGERVCAFVVLRDGAELSLDSVAQHFRRLGVARQKIPEELIAVDALPRNATGKIQKNLLREHFRQHAAQRAASDE